MNQIAILWGSVVPILDYSLEYSETVKKKYQFSGPILSLIQILTGGGLGTGVFFFFFFLVAVYFLFNASKWF